MQTIPKINLVLSLKTGKETEGYIKIRVGIPREQKKGKPYLFKSTGYKISVKHWDAEEEIVKKAHTEAGQINFALSKELDILKERFTQQARKGVVFTEKQISDLLNPSSISGNFIKFFDDHIKYLAKKSSVGYIKHLRSEYNTFVSSFGENLSFSDITTELLRKYELSLKVQPTTLHTKMKRVKEVIDSAIQREHISSQQIAGYKLPTYKNPEKEYLTLSETVQIAEEIYSGKLDDDPEMKKVACFFLIECYSGIRFSDWSRFKIETLISDRNLKVRARKNGQPIYLPLKVFTRLGRIIDYVVEQDIKFGLTEPATNRILKVLATRLGIKKKFTTHLGRHTCATLLAEMGYSAADIAQVLGISEITAKTYIKHTRQALDNAFAKFGGL